MKVLLSWLREYVDVAEGPDAIAARMSLRGFAVDGIEQVAGGSDAVLDFEVTGNRPDCMSVAGMAREIATAYQLPLLDPESALRSPIPASPDIAIAIDRPELCPRYVGAVADVAIGPSPEWMQARLAAGGIRPISNVVDITNYVLLELGQPMHAFDHALIGGRQIRVRTARPSERLRTLDDEDRTLTPEMLVIADASDAIALAGVKGGAQSEITPATRVIVFESAHFNPLSVRRTSRALGLKTDASMRFERGTDPELPLAAMRRALALLEQTGAGSARGPIVDCYPLRVPARTLRLRRDRIDGLLGTSVPDAEVRAILERLGFGLDAVEDGWDVVVPTRRIDVIREVDLIEEVARHHGFDRIPVTYPSPTTAPRRSDPRIARARQLRGVMTGAGFSEAMTFGFIGAAAAAPFAGEGDIVPIANPLSENFGVLRPSLLPGLLDAVAHNRRREQRDVRLFEIGQRFTRAAGERRALAAAWTGIVGDDHWSGGSREVDFFEIKGTVQRICSALGREISTEPGQTPWLTPGQAAAVLADGIGVGLLGRCAADVAQQHGLSVADVVFLAELDLDALDVPAGELRVAPLPRFPSVTRDIALLVDERVPAAELRRTVREAAPETLARVREFDRYRGKGVPEGKVSLALRLTFRALDRTLTDTEASAATDAIVDALAARHGTTRR